MLWDRSEPLEVYLSDDAVGRGATAAVPAFWDECWGLNDSLRHVRTWLDSSAAPDVRRVRVWLSANLACPYLVPAASGARNRREAYALAAAMASDATGFAGEPRLWLDRWRVGQPTLAVAIPASVWCGLQDIVDARNNLRVTMPRRVRPPVIEIASVRPWWNLPFDALLAESRADAARIGWSLSDGAGVLHGVVDRGSIVEIGFDRVGLHDPTGTLLRRRLQVNWGVTSSTRHLHFERHASGSGTPRPPIGVWRELSGEAA